MIKLVIGTANAAFADGDKNSEVARIIDDAADRIEDGRFGVSGLRKRIMQLSDVNGNKVGTLLESDEPTPLNNGENARIVLDLETDNAAFEGESKGGECARILREAAGKIREGDLSFKLRDMNGNTVGKVEEVGGVEVAAGEQKFELLKLYARKEPTTDSVAIEHGLAEKKDTVFYRDAECTDAAGRYSWHLSNCPRRGQDMAMLNCYKWKLEWLDDLEVSREPVDMDAPGALRHVFKFVGTLVDGDRPSKDVADWEKVGAYTEGVVADKVAAELGAQGHFSKIQSIGEYSPESRYVLNDYSPSTDAYFKAHPNECQKEKNSVDMPAQSLYAALKAVGIEMENHESDLYVPVTPETTAILARYPLQKSTATTFNSNINGERTYDIAFAYEPFWEKSSLRCAEKIAREKATYAMVDAAVDQKHEGKVLGVTDYHVVLSLGRTALIVAQSDLDRVPEQDEEVVVAFTDGKGVVEPTKGKDVGQGR